MHPMPPGAGDPLQVRQRRAAARHVIGGDREIEHAVKILFPADEITVKREYNPDGTVTDTREMTFTEKVTYKQDWPRYNRAQSIEKDRLQELLFDLCKGVVEPERKPTPGPKPHTYRDSIFAAGLRLCIVPVMLGVVAPVGGALYDRLGARLPTVLGMLICVAPVANHQSTLPLPSMPSARAAAGVRSMPARLVRRPVLSVPLSACGRLPVSQ